HAIGLSKSCFLTVSSKAQSIALQCNNLSFILLTLSMFDTGAIHLNSCPAQPFIPIYMIVLGSVSLFSLTLTYTKVVWVDGTVFTVVTAQKLHDLYVSYFTLTYSLVYPPNYSDDSPQYCFKPFYMFAFVLTTLIWASVGLIFICGGCFFLCTFWDIAAPLSIQDSHRAPQ
uniref:Uncharacterized protein n=1 Tax=Neogobius melanostomus TaxID=47308 RepID=A0A8C6S605_9GOBI